jgi:hypothetical protein
MNKEINKHWNPFIAAASGHGLAAHLAFPVVGQARTGSGAQRNNGHAIHQKLSARHDHAIARIQS